jgi:glycosyltransferase involved in cell wall biosynthesis
MVIVSCNGKLHSFNLAEQLHKQRLLHSFFTMYAYQKNKLLRKIFKRVDKEEIDTNLIHTISLTAFYYAIKPAHSYERNYLYDRIVAKHIKKKKDYKIFIGWSGMSLQQIKNVRQAGKLAILERGSSHILYQQKILEEEYARFDLSYKPDNRVIETELAEYEAADIISIPSTFVKRSFLEYGVDASKLFVNPYGAGSYFQPMKSEGLPGKKFTIVYLGTLSIQKGLIYLFQALQMLDIPTDSFEVHFIGAIDKDLQPTVNAMKLPNWQFLGHIPHYDLPAYLVNADVAIQPSLQEGLSMVIPQLLSLGIPVIASTNTGGEDIIRDQKNGFIVPIRSAEEIAGKINYLYNHPQALAEMKMSASKIVHEGFTWDHYGNRYIDFLKKYI